VAARGPRAVVDLRLRYLQTVGVFGTYEDGPLLASSAEPQRLVATGLELRPLFIGRWLSGRELGVSWVDLTLDSLGLELGAFFAQPQNTAFASHPGAQASLGIEVPLFGQATGLWLAFHGGLRWSTDALGGAPLRDANDRSGFLDVTVAWHQGIVAHVVDLRDKAPR
jgi:hypothetical protein